MFDRPAVPRSRGQIPVTGEPRNAHRSATINDDNEEETMTAMTTSPLFGNCPDGGTRIGDGLLRAIGRDRRPGR